MWNVCAFVWLCRCNPKYVCVVCDKVDRRVECGLINKWRRNKKWWKKRTGFYNVKHWRSTASRTNHHVFKMKPVLGASCVWAIVCSVCGRMVQLSSSSLKTEIGVMHFGWLWIARWTFNEFKSDVSKHSIDFAVTRFLTWSDQIYKDR